MDSQPSLNQSMRAILVDWLVEVQVSAGCGVMCWYNISLFSCGKYSFRSTYCSTLFSLIWTSWCLILYRCLCWAAFIFFLPLFVSSCRRILSWIMRPFTWQWSWLIITWLWLKSTENPSSLSVLQPCCLPASLRWEIHKCIFITFKSHTNALASMLLSSVAVRPLFRS